jgi:hypothetical protein
MIEPRIRLVKVYSSRHELQDIHQRASRKGRFNNVSIIHRHIHATFCRQHDVQGNLVRLIATFRPRDDDDDDFLLVGRH